MVDEKKEGGNKQDEDNDQELDTAENTSVRKPQDVDDSSDDGVSLSQLKDNLSST